MTQDLRKLAELLDVLILRAREFERACDFGGKLFEDAQRRLDAARSAALRSASGDEG